MSSAETILHQFVLIQRWQKLRDKKLVHPVWMEGNKIDVAETMLGPYTYRRISWAEFQALIEAAEALEAALVLAKKPMGSEAGEQKEEKAG